MFNKLLFVTLVLLVVGAHAVDPLSDSRVEDILKNIRKTSEPVVVEDAKANIEEFIKGYVNGVGSAPIFSVIKPCIQYDEQILKDLAQAAIALKSHTPEDVKRGIKLLGEAAKIVPVAAAYCSATGFDIKLIIKMIQSFSNPASFALIAGRNILINHVEVYREIKAIIEAAETHNYNTLGYWTARAMVTVLVGNVPVEVQDTKADLQLFAKGFLNGIASDSFFDEIKTCIADDKEIFNDLKSGIELIRSKEAGKVKEGVQLVGKAVQLIPVAARICGVAEQRIEKLVKLIQSFTDPKSFIFYVGKSILINRVEVFHEVQGAVTAYTDKNFTGTGYWVGKAMATIFLHNSFEVQDTKTDLQNFAKGFLNGIASDSFFDEIKTCIADDIEIFRDLKAGIELIRSKDAGKVKEGVQLVGKAVQLIPHAARACGVAEQRIEKLVKLIQSFTDPKSFIFYVGKSILINRVEVFHEIQGAVTAYTDKNFTGTGFWVGKAMATIFLHQNLVALDAKTDLQNFAKGFLQGVESDAFFDEIKTCIADDQEIANDLRTGIELIRSKEAGKVKEGIKLVGQAVQLIPQAAKTCGVADEKIQKIVKLIKSFTSPKSFVYYVGKSILINRVEVIHDIEGAATAYVDKNFTGTGYFVGKAMATIFLHNFISGDFEPEVAIQSDVKNFVEGFLEGAGSHPAFADLKACIADDQKIVADIKKSIELIKTKNPEKVKEGIKLIGEVSQIIPTAVQLCQATHADLKKLVEFIKSFTSPKSFLYYVGKSLIINRVEVISEINHGIDAYSKQNFTELGFWVGKAMDTIFLGDKRTLRSTFVEHLNEQSGWTAALPEKFKGMTIEEIKSQFLGANLIDYSDIQNLTVLDYEGMGNDLPKNFNSAEKWPGCVHEIRDQQHCGSCWAFANSEVLSDRLCIASAGKINVVLSPQYFLSCNNILNHGCMGGNPLFSWWFAVRQGLVTEECLPYQSGSGKNPVSCKSVKQCADGTPLKFYYSKKGSTTVLQNPTSIQTSILESGPVEAAFTVYEDFLHYTGGVYKHTSGSALGGHAVKIVGWGNENGQDYWVVANSWNTTWGEKGFFRIAFGECGIDKMVVVGQADIERSSQSALPTFF